MKYIPRHERLIVLRQILCQIKDGSDHVKVEWDGKSHQITYTMGEDSPTTPTEKGQYENTRI